MELINSNKIVKTLLCTLLLIGSLAIFAPQKEAHAGYQEVTNCTATATGSEYGQNIRNAIPIALAQNPSWSNFKKAAKNLAKAGVKGNIVSISYSLYNNFQKCNKKFGGTAA